MDQLTLTLHKTKDTKNKVVYGTKDGAVIQSVYIDKDALGGRSTRHASGGHIPAGSLEVWPESHWPGFALRQTGVL